jgi:hypothetical protein
MQLLLQLILRKTYDLEQTKRQIIINAACILNSELKDKQKCKQLKRH